MFLYSKNKWFISSCICSWWKYIISKTLLWAPLDSFSHQWSTVKKNEMRPSMWRKCLLECYRHCHSRKTVDECQRDTNTTGDVFTIIFTITYSTKCISTFCKQKFLSELYLYIQNKYNLYMNITFINGQASNLELIFCTLGTVIAGKQLEFSHVSSHIVVLFYSYMYC